MIKIAHESPKSIFPYVSSLTTYSYALVHLFEEDEEYYNLFKAEKAAGREIILDNSIFELGEAFYPVTFQHWVRELEPSWYIVPDVLEDTDGTLHSMKHWYDVFKEGTPGKVIGVVQGKTYEDIVRCYKELDTTYNVDMIAISFDYSYYEKSFPHSNKYVSWMMGRVKLLGDLLRDGVINTSKPHHLLGVALPQEGMFYKNSDYSWIYSMDTSNPVVHGIKRVNYTQEGLWSKESQKLYELINTEVTPCEELGVGYNIKVFDQFWNK